MVEIYEKERPSAAIVDYEKKRDHYAHGVEGHTGFRCGLCAGDSKVSVQISEHGVDHWQNKQIQWQEECDKIMVAFDVAVSNHFPNHLPANCQECPVSPELPEKPTQPFERRWTDSK